MKNFTFLTLCFLLLNISVFSQEPTVVNFEIVESPLTVGDLPFTASGQRIWGDYNNDGNIDMFIIAGQGTPFSGLYPGNGDGTYTEVLTDITMMSFASAVFFDYDNDGNLDLIIAGSVDGTATAALTELYHNSGAPDYNFELVESASFVGISAESGDNNTRLIEVVDYNNDGWLDVFLSGNAGGDWEVSGNARVVALYKNTQGTFELQTTPVDGIENFVSMNGGGIHCGDVNNDGYADMIVSGYVDGDVQTVTDLYLNSGDGTFAYFEESRNLFTGHTQGETFFADVNNDGWLDIIEIGRDVNNGWANFANLFINNQDLTFTKIENGVSGIQGGSASVATGDINNDGWIDIAASGWGPNMSFFYNNGDSTFKTVPIVPDIARARAGCINFVDFTNDGNLDFSIFGYRDGGEGTPENPTWPNYLLENKLAEGVPDNQAPEIPTNVRITQEGENVVISWEQATDDITPTDAIRYNIFIKSKTGSFEYTWFPADIETGMLKANGERPLVNGNSITVKGFNTADYIFGVQAIDNAKLASAFSTATITSSKLSEQLNVKVYSADQFINIINSQSKKLSYQVINLSGQNIYNGVCGANELIKINMSQNGIFLVKISDGINSTVQKVLVY